jgi:K+-transporting ATPase KdpF subunit
MSKFQLKEDHMHLEFIWAGIIAISLLIYLGYTILHPEKF